MPGLKELGEEFPETAYGLPSAPILRGTFGEGDEFLFLARHGARHQIPPHLINYRANIAALKACGAERLIGLAAVGGIGSYFGPRILLVPDQIIDYTHNRQQTFFDGESQGVDHIDFTQPYCEHLRAAVLRAARDAGVDILDEGTHGVTQGPRLETAAEVRRLEQDGCDIVGMTGMPEAALAKEAGLRYACCAFVVNWAAGKSDGEIRMAEIKANIFASRDLITGILKALLRQDANDEDSSGT
jgi:5'-methylthioadenosine phosphorylase/5'-methylthioinosine phosphorylase